EILRAVRAHRAQGAQSVRLARPRRGQQSAAHLLLRVPEARPRLRAIAAHARLKRQPPDFRVYSRPVRPGPPAFVASLCLLCACGPATPNPARPGAPTAAELELPPADKNLVLERSTTAQNGQPDPILEAMQAELG